MQQRQQQGQPCDGRAVPRTDRCQHPLLVQQTEHVRRGGSHGRSAPTRLHLGGRTGLSANPERVFHVYAGRSVQRTTFVMPARKSVSLSIGLLLSGMLLAGVPAPASLDAVVVEADVLYSECGLQGVMSASAFRKAYL